MTDEAPNYWNEEEMNRVSKSLTNISPSKEQIERIEALRETFKGEDGPLAFIIEYCPPSRERSLALTHIEDAVMWAVKSILVNERHDISL